uniref:Uncharacterized protein n=1 Tax=Arundo donax TaxID=35708 RepID=A0A0A8YRQ2_ARUDO
MVLLAVAPL